MSIEIDAREGAQTAVSDDHVLEAALAMPRSSTRLVEAPRVTAKTRPGGIVLIAVLAWIGSIASVLSGILVLTGVLNPVAVSLETAWLAIIVGVVSFAISFFLFTGSSVARVLMTVSFAMSLLTSIFAIATHPTNFVGLLASGLGALLGLALMYTARANAYYRR